MKVVFWTIVIVVCIPILVSVFCAVACVLMAPFMPMIQANRKEKYARERAEKEEASSRKRLQEEAERRRIDVEKAKVEEARRNAMTPEQRKAWYLQELSQLQSLERRTKSALERVEIGNATFEQFMSYQNEHDAHMRASIALTQFKEKYGHIMKD